MKAQLVGLAAVLIAETYAVPPRDDAPQRALHVKIEPAAAFAEKMEAFTVLLEDMQAGVVRGQQSNSVEPRALKRHSSARVSLLCKLSPLD